MQPASRHTASMISFLRASQVQRSRKVRVSPSMVLALAASLAACARVDGASVSGGAGSGGHAGSGGAGSGGHAGSGQPGSISVDAAPSLSCAEDVHKAEPVTLDLMLVVDSSGSMGDPVDMGTATKWDLATGALAAFVRDPPDANNVTS